MSFDKIGGKDCASKTVRGVIGTLDHLFLGFERRDHNERSKDLFTEDAHVRFDIGEDRRRDEEAFALGSRIGGASVSQSSAFGLAYAIVSVIFSSKLN